MRLGYTVVPKELKCGDVSFECNVGKTSWNEVQRCTIYPAACWEAVYSEAGKAQLKEQVAYYMNNAKTIKQGLKDAGYTVFGGVNAPYIWLKTPGEMTSGSFLITCWRMQMLLVLRVPVLDQAVRDTSD